MNNALIIFTRVPIEGQTKTRLMPFLTGKECAGLHKAFLKDISGKIKDLAADCFVFYTPRDEREQLAPIFGRDIICLPQWGDDLGERMKNAIGIVLRLGYEKAVLIGTDIPQIAVDTLQEAFEALDEKNIVINPTFDGGYYLIGMKNEYDSIWKVERYGTNTVIHDTLRHMEKEQLSVAVGKKYYDIDDKNDLLNLYKDIKGGIVSDCPATADYLSGALKEKLERENEED